MLPASVGGLLQFCPGAFFRFLSLRFSSFRHKGAFIWGDLDLDQDQDQVIQDLSGSWCIKGIGESMSRVDSSVPLIHHDPDKSWITDPDPDHPKGTHPKSSKVLKNSCQPPRSRYQVMPASHSGASRLL